MTVLVHKIWDVFSQRRPCLAPELTTKANDLIAALGCLAAAQESAINPTDLELLFRQASDARDDFAGLIGASQPS